MEKLEKIDFEIWIEILKTYSIPPDGNEKNWNMPQKFEMKKFENFHFL
jgi:hypothetical protein